MTVGVILRVRNAAAFIHEFLITTITRPGAPRLLSDQTVALPFNDKSACFLSIKNTAKHTLVGEYEPTV